MCTCVTLTQLLADVLRLERSASKTRSVLDQKSAVNERLSVVESKMSKLRIWLKRNSG